MARWLQKYRWYLLFTTAVGMMVYYGLRGEKVGLPNLFGALPQGPQPQAGEVIGVPPTVKPPADSSVPVQPPSDVEAQVEVPGAEDFSDSPVYVPDPIERLRDQAYEAMGGDGEFYTEEPFSWEKLEDPHWVPKGGLEIPLDMVKEKEVPEKVSIRFLWKDDPSTEEIDEMFLLYEEEINLLLLDENGKLLPKDEVAKRFFEIDKWVRRDRLASPYWFLAKSGMLQTLLKLFMDSSTQEAIFVIRKGEDVPSLNWDPAMAGLTVDDTKLLSRDEIKYPMLLGKISQRNGRVVVKILNWKDREGPIFAFYGFFNRPKPGIGPVMIGPVDLCLFLPEGKRCATLVPTKRVLSGIGGREVVTFTLHLP